MQVLKPKFKKKRKISKLQRMKDDENSSYWMRKCDGIFGKIFHQNYKHCIVTNGCKGRIEMAHLIPRENYLYRWDENAVVPLCSLHHKYSRELSYHNAPVAFLLWLKMSFPKKFEWLEQNGKIVLRKSELPFTFKEKYHRLLDEARNMGIEV